MACRHRAGRVCAGWAAICAGGQPGQHLRVVLRAGQDVAVADVEERATAPGLVRAVDVTAGTS